MDFLPEPLQLEILTRLNDPIDLAHCRLVSKTLNTLFYDLQSLNIICSKDRFLKYRAAALETSKSQVMMTPFKSVVKKLLLSSRDLENVLIGFDDSLLLGDNIDDDDDDLYLMDDDFVSEWLPHISPRLKSISISSFFSQSRRRVVSKILSLISSTCQNLVELTLKNVKLSVEGGLNLPMLSMEGLKPMSTLTSLTLERVQLFDKDLKTMNECFPSLRVLGLFDVQGLREPSIHLLHLQTCRCRWQNSQLSLTIDTPNLTKLRLNCTRIKSLVLNAPLLSTFQLYLGHSCEVVEVQKLIHLKTLYIGSCNIYNLIKLLPAECNAVQKLELITSNFDQLRSIFMDNVTFEYLVSSFPNVTYLKIWLCKTSRDLGMDFVAGGTEADTTSGWKNLEHLKLRVDSTFGEMELATRRGFISTLLEKCGTFSEMRLVRRRMSFDAASELISSYIGDLPWSETLKERFVGS